MAGRTVSQEERLCLQRVTGCTLGETGVVGRIILLLWKVSQRSHLIPTLAVHGIKSHFPTCGTELLFAELGRMTAIASQPFRIPWVQ